MQIRYYSDESESLNFPSNIKKTELVSGKAVHDFLPFSRLHIEALPGTKFYLNNSISPICINQTGIYDIKDMRITKLNFDIVSLERINKNEKAILLIEGL